MLERVVFDAATAESKIGRRVASLVDFSGVQTGTHGRMIRANRNYNGYTIGVKWNLPKRHKPLVDWFARTEYERFL